MREIKWGQNRQWKKSWGKEEWRAFLLELKGQLPGDDCWFWPWQLNPKTRYSVVRFQGKKTNVHRVSAWAFLDADLSEGRKLYACHTCDHPSCFNPDHLFMAPPKGNTRDAILKGHHIGSVHSLFCSKGHRKTYLNNGHKECEECKRARRRVRERRAS